MYIVIDKKYYFLKYEKAGYYKDLARKKLDLSDEQMMDLIIYSSKNVRIENRIWKQVDKIISDEYKRDKQKFIQDFMCFDFDNVDAADPMITNNLLWSYSSAFGHCYVMSIKLVNDEYTHDQHKDNWPYKFPGSNKVAIVHSSVPNMFRKLFYKMKDRAYLTIIDINDIEQIKGSLDNFTIHFKSNRRIIFTKDTVYDATD